MTTRPTIDEVARMAAPTLRAVYEAAQREREREADDGDEAAPTPPTAA